MSALDDDFPEMFAAACLAARYCEEHWEEFTAWAEVKGYVDDKKTMRRAVMRAAGREFLRLFRQIEVELVATRLRDM